MVTRSCRTQAVSTVGAFACAASVLVGACDPGPPPPTYNNAAGAILNTRCATCHQEGGIGTMPLSTWDDVEPFLGVIEQVVENRTMPPWPADKDCNTYANDFSLPDAERNTLLAWLARGGPEGDGTPPAGTTSTGDPRAAAIRADVVLEMSGPYVPKEADDYRCFAVAWPFDADTYVTGFDMLPGTPDNVHHVNIFLNPPSAREEFLGYEALDDDGGYDCRHGSSVALPSLIGSWAPGASGIAYPQGTGQLVAPGSVLTFQVHYASAGAPDASALVLELADTVERRGVGAPFYWFNSWDAGNMEIPAGDGSVTHQVELSAGLNVAALAPWFASELAEISIVAVHMHQLGSSGELGIRSPFGDTCLLKIPRWDFHQQMGFTLEKPAEIYLPDDNFFLSCTWDNSAGNQPFVDGVQTPPRDVNWGPRTTDEMCMGFVYLAPVLR